MPSIRSSTPPPLAPARPCTPVVPLRTPLALVAEAPSPGGAPELSDPFWRPSQMSLGGVRTTPYVLRPPRGPQQAAHRASGGTRGALDQSLGPSQALDWGAAARRGMHAAAPPSPTPPGRAPAGLFVPYSALPELVVGGEVWAESCCCIMQEPMAALHEPVVVVAHEALHVFEYAHLLRWLTDGAWVRTRQAHFKNPLNAVWTPLDALRRAGKEERPTEQAAAPAALTGREGSGHLWSAAAATAP